MTNPSTSSRFPLKVRVILAGIAVFIMLLAIVYFNAWKKSELLTKEGIETVGICTDYRYHYGKNPGRNFQYYYYVNNKKYFGSASSSIKTEPTCFGANIENQMYRVIYAPSDPKVSRMYPTKPVNELVDYGAATTATIDSLQYSNNRKRWIVVVGYNANGEKVKSEKSYEKLPAKLKLHQTYDITYSEYRLHKDLPSCFEFDFEY